MIKFIAIIWSLVILAPALIIFVIMESLELAKLISLKLETFLRE